MKYQWIEDINEFRNIADAWDRAICATGVDNPYLLSGFLETWWRHYSKGLSLRILVLFDDSGGVVGGIPLYRTRGGMYEHIGGIHANYTELFTTLSSTDAWKRFLQAIAQRDDWTLARLARYRRDRLGCDLNDISLVGKHARILIDMRRLQHSYVIVVPRDFSTYIAALPKKLRYYVNRSVKEFAKLGNVRLRTLTDISQIREAQEAFIRFSQNAFKKRREESALEDEKARSFFKDIVAAFHQKGFLDANVLMLNDRPIAIHFGYSITRNLNYVYTTFDINQASLNPGHLLLYRLVELGSKRENEILDMYTGYRLYKKQWCNRMPEVLFLELRPDTVRGRSARLATKMIDSLRIAETGMAFIKQFPPVLRVVRRVRSLVRNYALWI